MDKSELDNPRYLQHGSSIDNIFFIKYNNEMFYSCSNYYKQYFDLPIYHGKRNLNMEHFVVPNPHHNQTPSRQEFCKIHARKTFAELGIKVIPLSEFKFEDNI